MCVYSDFDAVHTSVGINLFFSVNISIFQAMNQKKNKEYVKKRRRSHSADSVRVRRRATVLLCLSQDSSKKESTATLVSHALNSYLSSLENDDYAAQKA